MYSVDDGHIHIGVLLRAIFRPVLVALHFHFLHDVSQHHHRGDVVVPDEPPEVSHSVWQRALCRYVLLLSVVALPVVSDKSMECKQTLKYIPQALFGASTRSTSTIEVAGSPNAIYTALARPN